ncbi:kinesin-like protein KIN-14I isoform X2 [Phalaenopsis equestris]|uniref:kinesin-like protein KIN-14I isoform X2 n=1 Tax=Phalaenopsis equestris TaxID=78828 RepID=UPI0009E60F25|nr:kinesin-like protein KIN-14I isoform X2 [Phalaenopsis equestris]
MERSSFSSSDGKSKPLLYAPTRSTSSRSLLSELAGATTMSDKFQVETFLRSMQKQISSARKRGFFSKKSADLPVGEEFKLEDLLCFQKDPIPTSLFKINGDHVKQSVKMFKLILKYMGVDSPRNTTLLCLDDSIDLATKLLKKTLKHSVLCDELFAQIFKQTRNNPNRSCLLKAWELMYLCVSSMSPSKDFGPFILEYVHNVAYGLNVDPDQEEIEALMTGKHLKAIVCFMDETFQEIMYDMTTVVSDVIQELARLINLSTFSSFSLYECKNVEIDSIDYFNEEFIRLDDNKYVGDLLAENNSAKEHSKGEILSVKLVFKRRIFKDSDKDVSDPKFLHLSYIQVQHDYLLGNYPSKRNYAAQLTALQILAEIGFEYNPESCVLWTSLLERFLPRQIAMRRAKRKWELDVLSQYNLLEGLSKDDAKRHFLEILQRLPYGNSTFFCMRKVDDPTGSLPGMIILGINMRGVHFFHPFPKEYLHSVELKDVAQFGSSNTAVFFKMKASGVLHVFQFETSQGEEICFILQAHIKDAAMAGYTKTQNVVTKSSNGFVSEDVKCLRVDMYEERVQGLSKAVEESRKKADELLEELQAGQKLEIEMQKELARLKDSLDSEKQNLQEVSSDRDELKKLCDDKESALQASLMDKQNNEVKLAELSSQGCLSFGEVMHSFDNHHGNAGYVRNILSDFQTITKLQDDLNMRKNEMHASKDTIKVMLKEKQSLEEKFEKLEKKNPDEISIKIKKFEDERLTLQLNVSELEKKLESLTASFNVVESTISMRNAKLHSLNCNLEELEELREMKDDFDRKNEQIASILNGQAAHLSELEALYKGEQLLRRKYCNMIEDMKGKIRVFCRMRPLTGKEIDEKESNILVREDEFTVAHPWKDESKHHFFDRVFDQSASQNDIFEDTKYLVQSAVNGYNVCIYAYGPAGSGKTFTIYGSDNHPGLIPRASAEFFQIMELSRSKFSFSLKVYMAELYQETLVDLLLPRNAKRLKLNIKKNSKGMVSIENITILEVSSFEELRTCILRGADQRHIAGNKIDGESSRSHLILSIIIESTNLRSQTLANGKFTFVDLASSERIKKTGSSGNQLKEAQSINKSHSAFGDVISALCSEAQHVPYRNHKLTMLMSDALGGNAKTLMFVNVSPAESYLDESYHHLMFASRVRCILNNPSKNISSKELAHLKKLVSYWREQAGKQGDDEELEEIQEERQTKEKN